jgi:hypothetical protein
MTKKIAFLIVAAIGLAAPAYAQSVRVITGDIEHIYGPGGQLLDDDALTARNERAERAKILRRERELAMRRQELDAAAAQGAAAPAYDEPYGAQDDGSYYAGTFAADTIDTLTCGGLALSAPFLATHCNSDMRMDKYIADPEKPAGTRSLPCCS